MMLFAPRIKWADFASAIRIAVDLQIKTGQRRLAEKLD
jgi:hypothetical protein